jgi:uncharacterized protein YndB with AHSA1/START domain
MAHASNSITIARPPADVFAFVLDGANNQLWRPAVLEISRIAGTRDGEGAKYRQRLRGPGGRPIDGDYEITTCQPNTRLEFRVTSGPARPTGTYRFAPADGGTRVTFDLDYAPTGLAKLMDPIIARTMRSEVATLENLKRHLETQPI